LTTAGNVRDVIDPRGRVWSHLFCHALSLAAGLGAVAVVPHIDPDIVSATSVEKPKLLGGLDREEPPGPRLVALQTVSGAVTGADEAPPPLPWNYRHPHRRPLWTAAHYQTRDRSLPSP
jgi:hypothetical protein